MTGTDATSRHAGASAWQVAGPGVEVYDTECEAVLGGAARLTLMTETDAHATGRPSALHLARAVPLQGGMPIVHAGHVIGAVGVSGASSAEEDQELSVLAAEAASAAARNGESKAATLFLSPRCRTRRRSQ